MKKLILTPALLLLAIASSNVGAWEISSFNGGPQGSGSVTVPSSATYTMQAYVVNGGFAVVDFDGYQVMDYTGYHGAMYQSGTLGAGTYSGECATDGAQTSAVATVTW
jgi:hypothetical protein